MESLITALLAFFTASNSTGGTSSRNSQKKKAFRQNVLFSILIICILSSFSYMLYDFYQKYNKNKVTTCFELSQAVDSVKLKNKQLELEINKLNYKISNINLEKYPFELNNQTVNEFRNKLRGLLNELQCSKSAINLFHNPPEIGYKPVNINGTKTYINVSVLISVSDGYARTYEEVFYQNMPLMLFAPWLIKYESKGYMKFHKTSANEIDKILMKLSLLDYDRVNSAYIFGIPNDRDPKIYGKYMGCLVLDFGNNDKVFTEEEIVRVKIFCEEIGLFLNKYRKIEL